MNATSHRVAAGALAVVAVLGISACASDEVSEPTATPSQTAEPSEEPAVNPDITAEQNAFVDELLAEPLPQDEATTRIEEAGYSWRLGTIDGEPQAMTMDYRIDRLTLTTQDGLVIDATWG